MSQYMYSPLPSGSNSIRLLRLLPNKDDTANIQCEIFEYSLQNAPGTHLYEALSYVWGNPDKKLPIFIHKDSIEVTVNLHAALLRLRNHSIERILWVDAICIDQHNEEEKEHQIQFMARIYSQANRVVVWLGDSADDSDLALEEIRVARDKDFIYSNNERTQQAVLALLQRPWFQRIWVLQEVAAARNVLIRCGAMSIDGYAFSLGVDLLKESYAARAELQNSIRSVAYLIRGAIFRPEYGKGSQDICSLGELIDMYHAHKATKRHDKVYALLGMSSDDLSEADLLPNYKVPWEELLQRLVKFLLCKKISVETWGNQEIAVIQSKGFVLGKVSLVQSRAWDNKQGVDVTILRNLSGQPMDKGEKNAHWTLQVSAKSIRDGDIICLLQGVSKPIIVRPCKDYFAIVMIAAIPENMRSGDRNSKWPKLLPLEMSFGRDFLLVWDWGNSLKKLQQAEYEVMVQANTQVLTSPETELDSYLDKATRAWNFVLILGDSEKHKKADNRLQDAVKGYKIAFGLKGSCMLGIENGQTPLVWAAGNGYNAVVNLLLTKASVDPDLKDKNRRTPLSWAASSGHEAIVKLLLETCQVDVDAKDTYEQTPLSRAASSGHEAVVKLLLETGQVDVNAKDEDGQAPLLLAKLYGHETVVKVLLETGQVNGDVEDMSLA